MKYTLTLIGSLLVGGLLAGNVMGQAQPSKKPETKPDGPAIRAPRGDRTEYLVKSLNLNPEQTEKVRAIFQEENQKLMELRTNKTLTPQERAGKFRELRDATNAKLKPVLTDEQWQKYSKMFPQRPAPGPKPPPASGTTPAPAK